MDPDDHRQAAILAFIGQGDCQRTAARKAKIGRKTLYRWRDTLPGFNDALLRAAELAAIGTAAAQSEIQRIVAAWSLGGLVESPAEPAVTIEPVPVPAAEPIHPPEAGQPAAVEADVIASDGSEIWSPRKREHAQARDPATPDASALEGQTIAEWLHLAHRIASDDRQPERLRMTALAGGIGALAGGPNGRKLHPLTAEPDVDKVRKEIGRDPGVGRETWEQVKRNVLGPPPEAVSEPEAGGDVVEMDPAARG